MRSAPSRVTAWTLQSDRRVGHHGGAVGDAGEHRHPCSVEIVNDLHAEAVLLERNDGRGDRLVVGQRGKAIGCVGGVHRRTSVVWLVCTLQAAFRAYDGQTYRYPITIRMFR